MAINKNDGVSDGDNVAVIKNATISDVDNMAADKNKNASCVENMTADKNVTIFYMPTDVFAGDENVCDEIFID